MLQRGWRMVYFRIAFMRGVVAGEWLATFGRQRIFVYKQQNKYRFQTLRVSYISELQPVWS